MERRPGRLAAALAARHSKRPNPLIVLRLVDVVLEGVVACLDLHVAELLLDVAPGYLEARDPVDDVDGKAETVDLVLDCELQRGVDVAALLVAAHLEVVVVGAPVGGAVDQPGIAVIPESGN